jgi:diguanylate cyclase (GGDEF)-like protein
LHEEVSSPLLFGDTEACGLFSKQKKDKKAMKNVHAIICPARMRLYLLLLQGMFLLVYGYHLVSPASREQVAFGIVLATVTLFLVTFPRRYVETAWFISVVTLSNMAVLFATFGVSNYLWIFGTVVLLIAMASYAPSTLHFSVLSGLIIGGYGFALQRAGLLGPNEVLVLPLLLCLTLVFVSKITTAQAEIQRIVKMDDEQQAQQPTGLDALTGLPNRAHFLERLERIVQYTDHNRSFRFAVLFLDLDGFKPINDKLGHKAGDAVLRHVARIFQSCLRQGDVVGRYGGDEFVFLLNSIQHPSEATQCAERIVTKLKSPIDVGERVTVGASIGIAFNTNLAEKAEELLRDADQAMYRAKAQGKNCYVISEHKVDVPTPELLDRWKRMMQLKWY